MAGTSSSPGRLLAAGLVGYLAGTIPSADLATRFAGRSVDLRRDGSGNPGAMNAASLLGRKWGLAVLAADVGKGAGGAIAGRVVGGDGGAYLAATAAIAGHIAPVWKRFRGGKGVATSAGACLAVFPVYFPIDVVVAAASSAASQRAEETLRWSCAAWTAAALLTWRAGLRNAWGPRPSRGLPLFAAGSSLMILAKFASSRRSSR